MITFHIIDAFRQDEEVQEETEEYVSKVYNDEIEPEVDEEAVVAAKQGQWNSVSLEKSTLVIHLFGTTAEGKSVRANVYGFQPYFYVRLPSKTPGMVKKFITRLHEELDQKRIPKQCVTVEICQKKLLYGYTGNTAFPFAMVKMSSLAVLSRVRSCFIKYETSEFYFRMDDRFESKEVENIYYDSTRGDKGGEPTETKKFKITGKSSPLEVYDSNLDPMLRFFHVRDIQPCGWVSIDGELEGNDQIDCTWDKVMPTKGPVPTAPFLLAIWDIECYSATGDFPVAKKGDPIIQIGVVLVKTGKPTEKHIFVRGTCDDVPGAIVHSKPTEKEMLIDWAACMDEWNVDFLIGYNTFGFDERYVWERAEQLKLTGRQEFQAMTRLSDLGKEVKLEEKRLSSSALGDNFLYTWTTHGRVQIDLFHYIKRSYNLASYKLDSVCQHFMSGKLTGVDTSEAGRWVLKTKSTGDVVIGRYVVLLDETGDVAVDKLKILDIHKGSGVVVEAGSEEDAMNTSLAVKWAVVKDDVSPADIFRLDRGSSADRARIAAYCVQDCDLTYELYKKLDVFNNAMAMANTCPVPVSYIFMRGQGVKIESLIFKECLGSDQVIKLMPNGGSGEQEESYEGAIVLDPKPGFYFESPVGVADFASLYPSTIESENISHDSLVWVRDYDTSGNFIKFSFGSEADEKYATEGVLFTDIEFDIWGPHPEDDMKKVPRKIITGRRICRYAQPPSSTPGVGQDSKGTLPTIVRKLLAARKAKRKEAEKESDPFRKALLDAEQLAYKLTANSLYGQLGSPTFKIRLQHLAASVTAYGRKQIMAAKEVIETFYGPAASSPAFCAETVYGDTDSLFINFNPRDPATGKKLEGLEALKATMHLTEEAGQLVTQGLKPPHDFEYDKVFYPFIIFSKKRYVGNKYEEDPEHYSQTSMGIATKRRDFAALVKTIYGGAIRILLTEKDIPAAVKFVQEKTMDLALGKMSMNQLTISKSLKAEYTKDKLIAELMKLEKEYNQMKSEYLKDKIQETTSAMKRASIPAHVVLARRMSDRDPGNAPASGDRIPYVYIRSAAGQEDSKLQGDRIEHPSYVKEKGLQLDARYYIEHQLENCLSQLFSLCLEQMPGYTGHQQGMEEITASRILFEKALAETDRQGRYNLAKKFGITIQPKEVQVTRAVAVAKAAAPILKKQSTLDRFMIDSMLIDASKAVQEKEKAKTKTKAPRAKKTVEVNA